MSAQTTAEFAKEKLLNFINWIRNDVGIIIPDMVKEQLVKAPSSSIWLGTKLKWDTCEKANYRAMVANHDLAAVLDCIPNELVPDKSNINFTEEEEAKFWRYAELCIKLMDEA